MVLQTVKLASLLIRQISRPIVHRLTESAKDHAKFRSVIEQIGQRYHTIDYTLQSKLFGFGKPKRVNSLSKDEALNVGTKILGETFVYGISASFLLYEYSRSQTKDKDRTYEIAKIKKNIILYEEKTEAEIRNLKKTMIELFMDVYRKNTNRSSVVGSFVGVLYISVALLIVLYIRYF